MPNAFESKSFKYVLWSAIAVCAPFVIFGDHHPWCRGVWWTIVVFTVVEYPYIKEAGNAWFWKANLIIGVIHAVILSVFLPYFATVPTMAMFIPIAAEGFLFFAIFEPFDPLHGDR